MFVQPSNLLPNGALCTLVLLQQTLELREELGGLLLPELGPFLVELREHLNRVFHRGRLTCGEGLQRLLGRTGAFFYRPAFLEGLQCSRQQTKDQQRWLLATAVVFVVSLSQLFSFLPFRTCSPLRFTCLSLRASTTHERESRAAGRQAGCFAWRRTEAP